ncbi:hypothetical protein PR003_g25423 [Phytophthora rubi]|uniref:RxLR effector protein n=1 Tax=Phytophthora rubi TaxID=129364 RepID=A0A6A4CP97_9STRA|nr:hypothetical protein PR001_g24256 [Phytophthora rubi]KAE9289927.1 hypothetical protein PR003_g25423 [Phytophthora rubi]
MLTLWRVLPLAWALLYADPLEPACQPVRGVVQRTTSAERPRKRRRCILRSSNGKASDAEDNGDLTLPQIPLACVANGDANLMSAGAEQCTGLNSDEDPFLRGGGCEDEEGVDDDGDSVEDWDIRHFTDEDSDEDAVDLPESVCLSAAENKKAMPMMRTNGWEHIWPRPHITGNQLRQSNPERIYLARRGLDCV